MVTYMNDAFGAFAPHTDKDAAIKFSLSIVLADERLDDLIKFLSTNSQTIGIEGEPGWILKRRNEHGKTAYAGWPRDAAFRAYVDPSSYILTFPEAFYDQATFYRFVRVAMGAYIARHPDRKTSVDRVLSLISGA
jgi:hypothetical protein